MHHQSFCRCLLAILLCGPLTASAQLAPGDRLRISQQRHHIVEGVYVDRDSLGYAVLLVGSDTVRMPMDGSYTAERYAGRVANGMGAFARGVGTGAGAGLSLVVITLLSPNGEGKALGIVLAGFATSCLTAIGAVAGAIAAGGDHDVWNPVAFITADGSGSASADDMKRTMLDAKTTVSEFGRPPSSQEH